MTLDARHFADTANSPAAGLEGREREQVWPERVRAGDEDAFEAMFAAYYPALCDFVLGYVRAPDVAEDLVQDVFLRIWDRHEKFEPAGSIGAYLFAACRNRALDHVKHEGVVARVSDVGRREGRSPGLGQAPSDPDVESQAVELADAFRSAVRELPERRRLVVVLRWEHGLSHAEIARVLGISVKGVETQFGRAMATLRARLAHFRS